MAQSTSQKVNFEEGGFIVLRVVGAELGCKLAGLDIAALYSKKKDTLLGNC